MTERQKSWDRYEAVVLLEGYLDMVQKNIPRNEVIERISLELRTMAVNQGNEINDVFRNRNGITFQIKSMESAYLGYTVMKPASKLFMETVALYKSDPNEYEKLRKGARDMIDGANTVEEKFMSYLASQVSQALFTELSSYYSDIEEFCQKLKILKKPLFKTTDFDTIKRVQKTIEQNKIYKATHKKNHMRVVAACRYYYVFVRDALFEMPDSKVDATQVVTSNVQPTTEMDAIENAENPDILGILTETDNTVQAEPSDTPNSSLEEMVREALREETEGNKYGTTISFLQGQIHCVDRVQIKAILDGAEWAKSEFGRYFFVTREVAADKQEEKVKPAPGKSTGIPLERTEEDTRLLQKYPQIYKRLFGALFEITESRPRGATVAELYAHVSRVGRPAVIEEILDNVSWASSDGSKYIFSREIVNQHVAIEDDDEVMTVSSAEEAGFESSMEEVLAVDFNGSNELAYTKPVSFTYFGEEKAGYSSWTDLYVAFFATICEDYPHVFSAGMSFSKNKGRVELMESGDSWPMIDPKPVLGTSFLIETNLSENHMILKLKYILDLCNVDYENVVIKYWKKGTIGRSKRKEESAEQVATAVNPVGEARFESFLAFLSKSVQMAERTAYNYALAISTCETIAKAQNYNNWQLYSEDSNAVIATISRLKTDPEFTDRNRSRHNQLSAALAKYELFLNGDKLSQRAVSGVHDQIPLKKEEPYKNEPYEEILRNNFKKGFRLESSLEIRKFRRYYSFAHNAELTDEDEVISNIIKRLCIIYDGKAYLPAVMLSDELKEKLLRYIEDSFTSGKTTIYYQAIYTEFAEEFLDYHIYDAEMLKAYLAFVSDGRFYINRSSISKQVNVTIDPLSGIRSCLQGYGRPVEYEELFAALPHLPQSKVKFILASNGEFVNNGRGAYFHESVIVLSEEELDNIADIISYTIEEKEFIGGNELYDAIKAKYPYIIESFQAYSVYGFRDALKYKLGDRFSFKGNIISRAGQELSMADVFANYAEHHDSFTLTELQAMAAELATMIYFDSVYKNSLRISREQFVSKSHAQFSIADTDAAIDLVCTGYYISIQEVTNFGAFPYAGFPWNSYLLEHYVAEYSRKYMLLHRSYNGTECAGAIVKRSAGIDSFDDFIVDLLVHNEVELKKKPVLQFLSDKGYLARRRYSNIESLIIKAIAQRNRKDTD